MHFKSIALFSAFLLPVAISAAPVVSDEVSLFARTVGRVTVEPHPAGDFQHIYGVQRPGPAPPGSNNKEVKAAKKLTAKWDQSHNMLQTDAKPPIHDVLKAADARGHLGFGKHDIQANVLSRPHASRSDQDHHWTFTFNHPACGGECTGHAYGPGVNSASPGKIWDASHNEWKLTPASPLKVAGKRLAVSSGLQAAGKWLGKKFKKS